MQSDLERIVVDTFECRCLLGRDQVDQIDAELKLHGMTRLELVANPDLLLELSIAKNIRRACDILQKPVSAHQSLVLARHRLVNASKERPNGVPLSDVERLLAVRLTEIYLETKCKELDEPFTEEVRKDAERMVAFGERGRTSLHAIGDASGCFQTLVLAIFLTIISLLLICTTV